MEVIGDMEQLGKLNWNVSENGIRLDPFKWKGDCDKCWKKLVKDASIFCGNVCVGRTK